jgi:hypothetical protein
MRLSYPHWIRFRGRTLGLVWQTEDGSQEMDGDTDAVLVEDGRIVAARDPGELSMLALRHGLILEEPNGEPQNLDGLEELLELPTSDDICAQVLNAWNLFGDIARSVAATLDDRGPGADKCYDKLFYGNNPVTPVGEHNAPYFDAAERRIIKEVLDRGRTILATHL